VICTGDVDPAMAFEVRLHRATRSRGASLILRNVPGQVDRLLQLVNLTQLCVERGG
jgi:ABC-type transporter Mla MlaB component